MTWRRPEKSLLAAGTSQSQVKVDFLLLQCLDVPEEFVPT